MHKLAVLVILALTILAMMTLSCEIKQQVNLHERLKRNLLLNGDFEQGLKGWSTEHYWYARGEGLSQWEIEEKVVKSGKRSLKVTGKNNRGIAIQDLRPPFPVCQVSGWLKCENLKGHAWIFIEFIDAQGKWLAGVVVGQVTGTTDWTFVSKEVTMPPDAVTFRVDLLTTEPNDGIAWFDDISVVPVLPTSDGKPPAPPKFQVKPVEGEDGALQISWDLPSEDVIAVQIFVEPKPFTSVDNLTPHAVVQRHNRSLILRGLDRKDFVRPYIGLVAIDVDGMKSKPEVQKCQVKNLRPPEPVFLDAEVLSSEQPKVYLRWQPHPFDDDIVAFELLCRNGEKVQTVRRFDANTKQATLPLLSPVDTLAVVAIDEARNKSQPQWVSLIANSAKVLDAGFETGENVRLQTVKGPVTLAPEGFNPTQLPSNLSELLKPKPLAKQGIVYSRQLFRSDKTSWGKLILRAQMPKGTDLKVEVTDEKGNTLIGDAKDGTDLSSIDAKVLRLKATLIGDGTKTPVLEAWGLTVRKVGLLSSAKSSISTPKPQSHQSQLSSPKSQVPSPQSQVPSPQTWFAHPLAHIFCDTKPEPTKTWELHVARNEWEAVQLAVRCERNFLWMRVKVEPEVERLFDVQIRYVGYIHLPANSRATPAEELVRKAPADFPDPLLDLPFVPLKANETQPVFVKLRPKRTTKAGVYNVPLIVQTPVGEQKANLRVRVYPFVFPDRTRLWFTNWFHVSNFAQYHGVPEWSNEHFCWMRLYAKLMREHRQNVLLVPLGLVRVWRRHDGSLRFDFERFDRFIETFEAEGVAERLELSHVGGRKTGRWEDPEFVAHPIWATDELTGEGVEVPLEIFLKAVRDHLKATKRLHKTMLHIADEPIPVNVESWKSLSDRVHRAVPDLPRIDAIHVPNLEGYLEVWVPQLDFFAKWFEIFKQRQREGNEIWFYTAWLPQGKWTNRLIDYPLIKIRLLNWFNVRYGATGFLHWGWNFWGDVMTGELQSPGDGFIVYPGPAGSLRMEAQRDGIEDAELLWSFAEKLAGKKKLSPEQASNLLEPILKPIIRNFTDYTKEPKELEAVRKQVLAKL
ncbi:MAG: DUF4091 domain-containing protein [Armatimonadetes bacterium]|nr:DUF4091 domain-containing protein [Armatimonadota bacterium]MDW8029338.1 DUF4091 domain-containing protein [Armatimonadota bacterium]